MSVNVYQAVTDKIVEALEHGVAPWRRPWTAAAPMNLMSQRAYRGINTLILGTTGYASPYWLTYRQAEEIGGHVRRGEHGSTIRFWKLLERESQARDDQDAGRETVPLLRTYTVFNLEQCDGIKLRRELTHPPRTVQPIAACEAVVAGLPAGHARILRGGDVAYYAPSIDEVRVPLQAAFSSDEEYYSTLFHELTHSTGHESRLGRESVVDRARFASHAYSREELIAEMGAAFLCGETGIAPATLDNSAAYLQSWIRVLKGDARLLVQAAGAAQKAVDWLRGRRPEDRTETPARTA
jgi:antirestriction protein ArdC